MNSLRKEIGSEFWSVPTSSSENGVFPKESRWFLSGRSALRQCIAEIQSVHPIQRVAMPAYCCDSMIIPFSEIGLDVQFYPVYAEDGHFFQDLSGIEKCDVLFRMDYFGYQAGENTADFDGICIHDLTHGIFTTSKNNSAYSFGSLRKWAGFYTGGYGWGFSGQPKNTADSYIFLRQQAMSQKSDYISGITNRKDYLALFREAEEALEVPGLIGSAHPDDVLRATILDVSQMRRRRRENANVLLQYFADIALFPEMSENDCPLFVPIIVPAQQRDALRQHLIENSVYCPIHWPLTSLHHPDAKTQRLYDCELSLVCDQRYTPEDMEHLAHTIKLFWKG